jgi:Xaa-Pro aminopeptidase
MKLDQQNYRERRKQLLEKMPEGSIMVIAAESLKTRNNDAEYPFRQSSNFYYLTGFNEPDALLVMAKGEEAAVTLFCPPRDPNMEIWTGYRAGPEGCVERFGADQAFNLDEIDERLPKMIDGASQLLYPIARDKALDARVKGWLETLGRSVRSGAVLPQTLADSDRLLHEMRLFKSAAEIELMQRAATISATAHCQAMIACKPGIYEFQLESVIQAYCGSQGARFQAYTPIVAGGANACILHYIENDQPIADGDLVLIDAGCELDNYASDITRTFPANGRFSDEQAAIYDLVLKANEACIEAVRPGTCWDSLHQLSARILTEGLIELGLLQGDLDELIEAGAFRRFYMHRIGHWLGMDVHDVGDYRVDGEWRKLAPGIVTTIEPGIYIAPDDHSVEERWRGIGVRIEDDVLVTEQGSKVLTAGVPKLRSEIEALMQNAG